MLGVELVRDEYHIGKKALAKLVAGGLPRTLSQLQAVLGRFQFCSQFVPEYRRRVKPLLELLAKTSDGRWTSAHT